MVDAGGALPPTLDEVFVVVAGVVPAGAPAGVNEVVVLVLREAL